MGTVGDSGAPLPPEEVASSWVMDGSEEEGPGQSCTKGGGGGRVRIVGGRVDTSGNVPNLGPETRDRQWLSH